MLSTGQCDWYCTLLMASLQLLLVVWLAAAASASAAQAGWNAGPAFPLATSAAGAVNKFVGQVPPTGKNQIQKTINFGEVGFKNAQNVVIKNITITYGPEEATNPITVGFVGGPGITKYVQEPVLEGGLGTGVNIQFNTPPGSHFVAFSFGGALGAFGNFSQSFYVNGLGSGTVGSGTVTTKSLQFFSEGKFTATNIYTSQITIVPNQQGDAVRFAVDNVAFTLEQN